MSDDEKWITLEDVYLGYEGLWGEWKRITENPEIKINITK